MGVKAVITFESQYDESHKKLCLQCAHRIVCYLRADPPAGIFHRKM
jgi:hypothetical protein